LLLSATRGQDISIDSGGHRCPAATALQHGVNSAANAGSVMLTAELPNLITDMFQQKSFGG